MWGGYQDLASTREARRGDMAVVLCVVDDRLALLVFAMPLELLIREFPFLVLAPIAIDLLGLIRNSFEFQFILVRQFVNWIRVFRLAPTIPSL